MRITQAFKVIFETQKYAVVIARFPNANGLIESIRRIEPDHEWMDFHGEFDPAKTPDGDWGPEMLEFAPDGLLRHCAKEGARLWDAYFVTPDVRVAEEWERWSEQRGESAKNCRIRLDHEIRKGI